MIEHSCLTIETHISKITIYEILVQGPPFSLRTPYIDYSLISLDAHSKLFEPNTINARAIIMGAYPYEKQTIN